MTDSKAYLNTSDGVLHHLVCFIICQSVTVVYSEVIFPKSKRCDSVTNAKACEAKCRCGALLRHI